MNYKNYKLIIFAILISLGIANTANAGLISLITKASKAVKKADFDIPVSKIELPEHLDDFTPARIRPNSSGQWDIKLDDGAALSFDDLVKRGGSNDRPVLVLESVDIPRDFSMFKSIPELLPIYIRSKSGKVFELQRGKGVALKYKNVRLPVKNENQLKDGIWHLQRPALAGPVRLFQLDKDVNKRLQTKVYGSKTVVEKVAGNVLLDSMALLKRQTVVISAPIKNGLLEGISIKQLQKAAADNDINLVIIDSDKPAKLLKGFAKDANVGSRGVHDLYDTTGDFLNKFRDPKNSAPLELNLSDAGNAQSVIQLKLAKQAVVNKGSLIVEDSLIDATHISLHLFSKAVTVYRPDVERSKELDRRIVPGLHSDIHFYLIASTILGLFVFSTSWSLWKRLWSLRRRTEYSYVVEFLFIWFIHRLLFILLFIPVFGLLNFIYAVVMLIVKIINFLFISPVRWVIGKVSG
ncbi:MAG: hypothetical protein KAT25_00515 [Sulfuriflexus sp.]|nr:hypothetical protein [Sulfuriflexus sp.]